MSIHRSGIYYKPREESILNLELMKLIDSHYLEFPNKGSYGMYTWLREDMGYLVNKKRIDRLYYDVMGLRAIMPGPHTSKRNKEHKVFPYLLRDMKIEKPNQVWATDITYIPMKKGFMYLSAIIDVYSRYVVNWSISNTMESSWCKETLQEAIDKYGKPEILNTDQGSQFTANEYTKFVVEDNQVKLSMDGKGRATDNAFIERLWRTVKYEKVYLNPPKDGLDLYKMLDEFFHYYNFKRRHQGIDNQKPVNRFVSHISTPSEIHDEISGVEIWKTSTFV